MSDWQPIETAPKDGTEVLLAIPTYGVGPTFEFAVGGFFNGAWFGEEDDAYDADEAAYQDPTHWMPLPEPPR